MLPRLARLCALAAAFTAPAHAQLFTTGDLLVSTYGNIGVGLSASFFTANTSTGGVPNDGVPTPISLLEYNPVVSVQSNFLTSYTLPVTNSGASFGIVGEYGSSSEGTIQLSTDGRYLTVQAYSAAPSIAGTGSPGGNGYSNANGVALAQSTSIAVPRVFGLVDAYGNANTSTVLNDVYSTNNPRSAATLNGTALYISGQGSSTSDQGTYLTTVGNNTVTGSPPPIAIYNATDTRILQIDSGNLFYSVDKKNKSTGIFEYTGLPTGPTAATQIIPGNNGAGVNYSPDGFYFANSTVLYIADTGDPKNGGTPDGGIQKWVFNGTAWGLAYTLQDANFTTNLNAPHGETGFEAIAGQVLGSGANTTVNLFAVSYTLGDADPDGLYGITDSLDSLTNPGETFTEVAASSPDDVFKGVSFAPVPEPGTSAALAGIAMGLVALGVRRRRPTR